MGCILRWELPDLKEVTYDKTEIYKSSSKEGPYMLLAVQNISDNTYFDVAGTENDWYKIRFYDSVNNIYSAWSQPMQGGTFFGFCTVEDVRNITNITQEDLSDTEIFKLIQMSMIQLLSEITNKVVRERVDYIDNVRKNQINGQNKIFYVKNWKDKYISDLDCNGEINTSDIEVYKVSPGGIETKVNVVNVYPNEGKFELEEAPVSGDRLFVTYCWSYLNVKEHPLVRLATIFLTAAYAYAKINVGKAPEMAFGQVRLYRHLESFEHYFKRYREIVNAINSKMFEKSEFTNIF